MRFPERVGAIEFEVDRAEITSNNSFCVALAEWGSLKELPASSGGGSTRTMRPKSDFWFCPDRNGKSREKCAVLGRKVGQVQ